MRPTTAALVSRHRSDVVGCAQPSESSARRIACPYRAVLASDATPRCASMASADRQMIGDATLAHDAVVQGLSELPFMSEVKHWGVLTIGRGWATRASRTWPEAALVGYRSSGCIPSTRTLTEALATLPPPSAATTSRLPPRDPRVARGAANFPRRIGRKHLDARGTGLRRRPRTGIRRGTQRAHGLAIDDELHLRDADVVRCRSREPALPTQRQAPRCRSAD